MGYGRIEKLRDGTERYVYVPQSKDRAVFEVIPVEILEVEEYSDTTTVKIISTGKVLTYYSYRVKNFQDSDVIYQYIGTEDELLFIRQEMLQDGTERLVYTPGDKDKSVFEVIRVKVLEENTELKMKKIQINDTQEIDYVSSDSVKNYNYNTVIYNYLGSEKDVLQSAVPENTYNEDCDSENYESGELRYNPDSGSEEYYPDWLGGVESEEEFWEH